jgi:hypothetical protein
MGELEGDCCSADAQEVCCEPDEKGACCGEDEPCGCAAAQHDEADDNQAA